MIARVLFAAVRLLPRADGAARVFPQPWACRSADYECDELRNARSVEPRTRIRPRDLKGVP